MHTSDWPDSAISNPRSRGRAAATTGVTLLLIVTLVLAASPAMARSRGLDLLGRHDAAVSRLSTLDQARVSQGGGENDQDPRRIRPGVSAFLRLARAEMTSVGVLGRLGPNDSPRAAVLSAAPLLSLLNLPPPALH